MYVSSNTRKKFLNKVWPHDSPSSNMPYKKSPLSLQELCLNAVIAHFDDIQEAQISNQPSEFIENIYERMSGRFEHVKRRLPANIFIRADTRSLHRLHTLDLSIVPLVNRIADVCKDLIDLSLAQLDVSDNCSIGISQFKRKSKKNSIPSATLTKLVQNIPQIQKLNFDHEAECTDHVIAEIAKNCRKLRHLRVRGCRSVTDEGLRSLGGMQLELLDIRDTGVTAQGWLDILNQLPGLKKSPAPLDMSLLYLLKRQFLSNFRTYSLENLGVAISDPEDISILIDTFPNLRRLRIMSPGPIFLDFNEDILPALQISARNNSRALTALQLVDVRAVNVQLINRSCPMLEKLKLVSCTVASVQDSDAELSFKNLRKVEIFYPKSLVISAAELAPETMLVQCRSLEDLRIWSETLTDALISQLAESNGLGKLRRLFFTSCPLITERSIVNLLEMENPLSVLGFCMCSRINERTSDRLKLYAQHAQLDLKIELSIRPFQMFWLQPLNLGRF